MATNAKPELPSFFQPGTSIAALLIFNFTISLLVLFVGVVTYSRTFENKITIALLVLAFLCLGLCGAVNYILMRAGLTHDDRKKDTKKDN